MSPVEFRTNSVSLQTQWWTAECWSPSVGWMLQQDTSCSSSSVCCHCSCSSQSQFSSTQHRPAAKDNKHTDRSSHTSASKDSVSHISFRRNHAYDWDSKASVSCQSAAHDGGGLVVVLTLVSLSDDLQQTLCRIFMDREQRNGGRSFSFSLQQLQPTLSSNSQQPDAADTTTVDRNLLPREARTGRTYIISRR